MKKLVDFLTANRGENSFLIGFSLVTLGKALGLSSGDKVYLLMFIISLIFMGIKVLCSDFTWKEYVTSAVLIAFGGLLFLKTKETTILFSVLLFLGVKEISIDRVLRTVLPIWVCGVSLTMILAALGVIESNIIPYYDTIVYRDGIFGVVEGAETVVYEYSSFGFPHPNTLFFSWLLITMIYLYLRFDKLNWRDAVVMTLPVLFVFKLTYCRTGLILYILMWLMTGWIKLTVSRKYEKWNLIFFAAIPVALIFTLIFPRIYHPENRFLFFVNTVFTGRLHIMHEWLEKFPVTLFGQICTGMTSFLDSIYPSLLLKNGIISLALLIVVFLYIQINQYKNKNWKGLIMITMMITYGVMEEAPINIVLNPFLILAAPLMFGQSKKLES